MSRDYKGSERKGSSRSSGGSLFIGILIGLVLGLGLALGVAWYINKMPNPFQQKAPAAKSEPAKTAEATKSPEKGGKPAAEAKPRFDFYKILPGVEEPATDQQLRDAKGATKESFYLQAGAFQNAPDADNPEGAAGADRHASLDPDHDPARPRGLASRAYRPLRQCRGTESHPRHSEEERHRHHLDQSARRR